MRNGTKSSAAFEKFFDALEQDMRRMPASEQAEAYETLTSTFNARLVEMRRHQAEVEFGQHMEGLYDINPRESFGHYREGRPKWSF